MGRNFRRLLAAMIGFGLAACGLDSNVSAPDAPMSPSNGGATLSGAGAPSTDIDAAITEFGDTPMITVDGGPNGEASAGGDPGGIDSGGAPSWSAGGIGGAASNRGGAAGAGGTSGAGARGGAAGASTTAGASGSGGSPTALFFSEYVEGSSYNKALEIIATQTSVLDTCKVAAYFNGSGEASVIASLSGVLEAGHVLTLCTSTLKAQLGAVCDQIGRLTFNGNDAVALACDGRILDVIGQIGVDPGAAWGSGSATTVDHTLRRKCSIVTGDPSGLNVFDPSLEWDSFPIDTFSGLGTRGC